MKETLKVVIPVYNEEGAIAVVIEDWTKMLVSLKIDFHIYIYNDGSKDDTLLILNNLAKENSHLVIVDKPNSGHGPSILKGYKDNLDAKWLFQVDSDNELKAADFDKFWKERKNFDFIIGKRIQRESPLPRMIITQISRLVIGLFYGFKITDVNTPYRLIKVEAFSKDINRISDNTFAPNLIISGLANLKNRKIKQIELIHHNRQTGEVSIKKWKLLKAAFKSFWQTMVFRFR